ncbi:MAG: DHH family phosphoesterase [Thermodesulfobacteriota bacterium]|nr:DHH family phosphoesterase [Thermodesulfobacteriota bacterium]
MNASGDIKLANFAHAFRDIAHELNIQKKKVLITMHRYLDADAFGSAVALSLIFKKLHVESTLLCIPFIPEKLQFLTSMGDVDIMMPLRTGKDDVRNRFTESVSDFFSGIIEDYGALAILDCAGFAQIPQEAWAIGSGLAYKINIDHHVGYQLQCDGHVINLVEGCSSTCEVLYHLTKLLGMDLFPEIAVPLYTGAIADLRKNEITRDSPLFPEEMIRELDFQSKKKGFSLKRLVKTVFALDLWEKCLITMTLAKIRFSQNSVYVKFDHNTVFSAKQATNSLDNPKMPFHEFHIRLRQRLKRYKKSFQIVVIFDQILGKVSLFALQQKTRYDLAQISQDLGGGGGHRSRAGFSFASAKKKLLVSESITDNLSDDQVMDKMIEVIERHLSDTVGTIQ